MKSLSHRLGSSPPVFLPLASKKRVFNQTAHGTHFFAQDSKKGRVSLSDFV
jgi:hypothetical protein